MTRNRLVLGLATAAAALALAGCETYGPVYGSPVGGPVYGQPGYGTPAYGQPAYPQGGYGQAFVCESDRGGYRECGVPGGGQVALVRQLSESACIPGRTWGQRGGAVWVNGGCRGEFSTQGGYGYGAPAGGYAGGYVVTCNSEEGRTATCGFDGRMGRPVLIEQLSSTPCQEGATWGQSGRNEIWVSRGCRGRFGVR